MPNIYDIAEKRAPYRMSPIEATMQGEQWRSEQKARDLNVEAADIRLDTARSEQAEFEAGAGSRQQAQAIADIVAKHAAIGGLLKNANDKASYELIAPELQKIDPETGWPSVYEESIEERAAWQPYFDEQYAAQQKLISLKERADGGDKAAAKAYEAQLAIMEYTLREAAAKAEKAETDVSATKQEISTNKADEALKYANARESDANARKADAEAKNESGPGGGDDFGASDSNAIYRQVAQYYGGLFDDNGNLQQLDPKVKSNVMKITAAAEQKRTQYGLTHGEAVRQALIDAGEEPGSSNESAQVDRDGAIERARVAIARGANRDAVLQRLSDLGINDADL